MKRRKKRNPEGATGIATALAVGVAAYLIYRELKSRGVIGGNGDDYGAKPSSEEPKPLTLISWGGKPILSYAPSQKKVTLFPNPDLSPGSLYSWQKPPAPKSTYGTSPVLELLEKIRADKAARQAGVAVEAKKTWNPNFGMVAPVVPDKAYTEMLMKKGKYYIPIPIQMKYALGLESKSVYESEALQAGKEKVQREYEKGPGKRYASATRYDFKPDTSIWGGRVVETPKPKSEVEEEQAKMDKIKYRWDAKRAFWVPDG